MAAAIHVVPATASTTGSCAADIGHEFGHYGTREAAELAAQAIRAEEREPTHYSSPYGKTSRKSFKKRMGSQMLGR